MDKRAVPGEVESRWVQVGGLNIHYRFSSGSGRPLVLLPGGMLDSTRLTWKHTLEELPAHYCIYAPDLPGYGQSDQPLGAAYTTEYFIDFLDAFLAALHLDRVLLFASSMGGAMALGFTLRNQSRVEALVLSGAYGFQDRVPLHEAAYTACRIPGIDTAVRRLLQAHPLLIRTALPIAVYPPSAITDELVADTYAGVQGPHALHAFVKWMRTEIEPHRVRSDFSDRLAELTLPVLLFHGDHDWMMPIRYARRAAALFPDAELHTFASGHLVPREWPEEVNRLIVAFLERVSHSPLEAPSPSKDGGTSTG